jgi:hypothetical protein
VATDHAGVAQVSRPVQIALAAVVVLGALWFVALKPKSDTSGSDAPLPTHTAPGTAGLTKAVAKAEGASAASDAANAKIQSASAVASGDASTAAPAAATAGTDATAGKATAPAAAASDAAAVEGVDPSARLLSQLDHGKVVVLLFSGKGADDRAARAAVRRAARRDKRIAVRFAPVAEVGRYEAITSGVKVLSAPTALVIGSDHKAKVLDGFIDVDTVGQTVGDVRRELKAAAAKK